tara:strand:+ start:4328 stop:4726 length:399 start_codon:yes stop_codon:yes gene_type:complete
MFSIRNLNKGDYDTLCKWWKENRFPIIPKQILPDNGLGGIMIQVNGIDRCACFLYLTNSKICWLEYLVIDFQFKDKEKRETLKEMAINQMCIFAKELGYEAVFTSVKKPQLIKTFEKLGFSKDNSVEMAIKI